MPWEALLIRGAILDVEAKSLSEDDHLLSILQFPNTLMLVSSPWKGNRE